MPKNTRTVVLSVENISVTRDTVPILKSVNWRVLAGEHWVLLGANGSGKTSLLSVLTGYLMPTRGDFSLLGKIYGESDWRELRKKIGIVSSSVRQMMAEAEPAWITVASAKTATIDFWGTPTRAEKSQAIKLLHQVECAYLVERTWAVLSQGERQRVLIARALRAQPRVLILDEPCAGLDPAAREQFLQFVQRLGLRKNAPTLIFVTHHVEEIMPVFSHVLILNHGQVSAAGKKNVTLNAENLAKAFHAKTKLAFVNERYQLQVIEN